MSNKSNLFLDSMPDREREVLSRKLMAAELKQHDVLFDVREVVSTVYFPLDAVISLVVPLSTGELIEAAMVGRDGVISAGAALDGKVAVNRAIVQLGGDCLQCDASHLRSAAQQHPKLNAIVIRHEQALLAQTQQSAACNVTHDVESRLARWLLRAHDLYGREELALTQDYLAQMLGVQRTSVSLIANTMQRAGLIRYRRGNIRLLNLEALEETACECYDAVKLSYDALRQSSNE